MTDKGYYEYLEDETVYDPAEEERERIVKYMPVIPLDDHAQKETDHE